MPALLPIIAGSPPDGKDVWGDPHFPHPRAATPEEGRFLSATWDIVKDLLVLVGRSTVITGLPCEHWRLLVRPEMWSTSKSSAQKQSTKGNLCPGENCQAETLSAQVRDWNKPPPPLVTLRLPYLVDGRFSLLLISTSGLPVIHRGHGRLFTHLVWLSTSWSERHEWKLFVKCY